MIQDCGRGGIQGGQASSLRPCFYEDTVCYSAGGVASRIVAAFDRAPLNDGRVREYPSSSTTEGKLLANSTLAFKGQRTTLTTSFQWKADSFDIGSNQV